MPIVDVPTDQEWYRIKLIKESKTLNHDRIKEINRLHALFFQCGITTIKRSDLKTHTNRQLVLPQLFDYEARQAARVCERLTVLDNQIAELNQLIEKECKEDKSLTRQPKCRLHYKKCTSLYTFYYEICRSKSRYCLAQCPSMGILTASFALLLDKKSIGVSVYPPQMADIFSRNDVLQKSYFCKTRKVTVRHGRCTVTEKSHTDRMSGALNSIEFFA